MKRFRRVLAVSLLSALLVSVCGGCSGSGGKTGTGKTSSGTITFPLEQEQTLTVWMPVPSTELTSKYSDFSNLPRFQEIEKKLNVKIKAICPTAGSEKDQFNLMIASNNLPDILDHISVANYYSGGVDKAYSDGVIIRLNELQEKYAPDLMKIYDKYADVNALSKNDNGDYLFVPMIKGEPWIGTFAGPIVRQDWLTELGLSKPETISDWQNMLTQFKTKKGASAPLLLSASSARDDGAFGIGFLSGAYGIIKGYFVQNDKVIYGAADSRWRDFLTEMAKWYSEGLIDPEIGSNSSQTYNAKAQSNKTGAFFANAGSGIGTYLKGMASVDSQYNLVGVDYPSLKAGETCKFYHHSSIISQEACITSSCKNPALAMAYLNYGFTKEGYISYNFGTETESFTWQNGVPTFTSQITKNPDGLTMGAAIQKYACSSGDGDMIQSSVYQSQYYPYKQQMDAVTTWSKAGKGTTPADSYDCHGRLTSDETSQISPLETQINSYRDEMLLKFITGVEPLNDDTWKQYTSQLNSLGLQTCLKVRQTAEDRFKSKNPSFYKAKSFSSPQDIYGDIAQLASSK